MLAATGEGARHALCPLLPLRRANGGRPPRQIRIEFWFVAHGEEVPSGFSHQLLRILAAIPGVAPTCRLAHPRSRTGVPVRCLAGRCQAARANRLPLRKRQSPPTGAEKPLREPRNRSPDLGGVSETTSETRDDAYTVGRRLRPSNQTTRAITATMTATITRTSRTPMRP